MSQNLKLGQYKSLNANARIFELRSAEKYMNFLKLFKPFYIDKYFTKLEEDSKKKEMGKFKSLTDIDLLHFNAYYSIVDIKSLKFLVSEILKGAKEPAVKWVESQWKKMEEKANNEDLEGFWSMYPDLKQYVDLFLIDYFKIFPDSKPKEEENEEKKDVGFQLPKKNFFASWNDEDDVIKAIKLQKSQNNKMVKVNVRDLKEDNKVVDPKAKLQADKEKLKALKLPDMKGIDDELIFKNAQDIANAWDQVGPTFAPQKQNKLGSSEAPSRKLDSPKDGLPSNLPLMKFISEKPQPSSKGISEEIKPIEHKQIAPEIKQKIEETK